MLLKVTPADPLTHPGLRINPDHIVGMEELGNFTMLLLSNGGYVVVTEDDDFFKKYISYKP